jgi:hypothetical protein
MSWAVVQLNANQLPGSCRNWFTVQRWVDVSNPDCGITWAPLDAPMMEIGGLTANLLGSVAFQEWMPRLRSSDTARSFRSSSASLFFANSRFDVFRLSRTCLPRILSRAKIVPDDT